MPAPSRLLAAAALAGLAGARTLTDDELTLFYGPKRVVTGPTRPLPTPLRAGETLKEAAKAAGIYVAAAINYAGMTGQSQGPNYAPTALSQFSAFTAENECKTGPLRPAPDQFDWAQCDYIMGTGVANGSAVRFHNTCWGAQNPGWLNSIKDPNQLTAALQEHIGNVTAHYLFNKSLAYFAIDVVNEAVCDSCQGNEILKPVTPWYPALPTYLNVAFTAAAAAMKGYSGPAPLLTYNDYGGEGYSSGKAQRIITLVKQLQAAGVPIDSVGLQMHISVDQHPDPADVAANIKALGELGLKVQITEMDVKCSNCNSNNRLQAQAQLYADILQACLNNTNCVSFETWGIYDGDTWVGTDNAPLLWDTNWNPKPAYDAVLATLQAHAAKRQAEAAAARGSASLRGGAAVA